MRTVRRRPIPGWMIGGGGLFFIMLHFALWPMIWHWVLLPSAPPGKPGFRVESYCYDLNFKAQDSIKISSAPVVTLDKPLTFLNAYAVWQVPQGGIYRLRLCGEGRNGTLLVDSRPIISLPDLNSWSSGETQKWLSPGPHLLELRLRNRCQPAWLRIEADGPGQINKASLEAYEPQWSYPEGGQALRPNDINVLDLGNIEAWLTIVHGGEYLCLLGILLSGGLVLRRLYVRYWAGNIFPNRRWKILSLALALFALAISWVDHLEHPMLPIWSDGLGYYSYLPSYLIYHDLSMEGLYEPTRHYDYPSQGLDLHPGEGFLRHPATGRYLIKYPLGTAALEFPFFLLGHLAAPFLGSTPDGFSWPYQVAMDTATTVYMLLGLIFLYKLLNEYFSSRIVLITLLSLYFGTNFLAYVAVESSLSHAYSFCLVCLFLWLVPRWTVTPSRGNSALLGLVCGLIPLVRNTNALLLLFLPLYGVTGWEALKEKVRFLWLEKKRVLLLVTVAALVFSPQLIIWKLATGRFFVSTYTYPFEHFYFLSPKIFKVLFSPHHGLFIWSPILILAVPGLFRLQGPLRAFRWPIAVCLLLQLYLISSWYLWYFGWSFGHRAFVDVLGLFAIPLAGFFSSLRRLWVKRTVAVISFFFIALTFYWFIEYFQGALPGEMRPNMTWPIYYKMARDPQGARELWRWLKKPELRNHQLHR